jgi:hypothetical protein
MTRLLIFASLLLACFGMARAQETVLPGRPDASVPSPATSQPQGETEVALAPAYESLSAGISLQPPAGSKQLRRPLGSDEIVEFDIDAKHLKLTV